MGGGEGVRVGIAVARFNEYVTGRLLECSLARLAELGVFGDAVRVCWTPGAFELPFAARKLGELEDVDAVICLGSVIRGETSHFDHVAYGASLGIARVALELGKPVIFGVLTTDTAEQAVARAGQGASYADSAVEMARLARSLGDGMG